MGRYSLDLRGVFAKLERASEHIAALDHEVREFQGANPITTFAEFEGGTTFLVKVRVPETPDLRWGVLLGDAIHNVRCALDHAVWELVRRNVRARFKAQPTQAQERRITYPIAYRRKDFYNSEAVRFLTTRQVALFGAFSRTCVRGPRRRRSANSAGCRIPTSTASSTARTSHSNLGRTSSSVFGQICPQGGLPPSSR
jgi:hypothetical protein